ncbi:beta-lactamase family protein [Labilibacter sediminis]|nr:beta-lactamase family protein [Labilibacter sediminis]
MKKIKTIKRLVAVTLGLGVLLSCVNVTENKEKQVVSEQISVVREYNNPVFNAFTADEAQSFMNAFVLTDALMPGRAAAWFGINGSQVFPTEIVPNRQQAKMMSSNIIPQIGEVTATTKFGEMKLDEFLNHAGSNARGFVVVHKGKIVYEQYLGMLESDPHVTASAAKVFASLLVEVLIEEGQIDEQKTIGDYIPEFEGTHWDPIKVVDVMDMTTGLDPIDGPAHFANPETVSARLLRAELGEPYNGEVEKMIDVLKLAQPVCEPGSQFTYSSTATQVLTLLAEAVSGQTWAEAFDQQIWSKTGAEGSLQVHLSPEGTALAHGFLSIRLRDLARFGMLYTPSWKEIAYEQVVTPEILERTRAPYRDEEFYRAGPSGQTFMDRLGDNTVRTGGRQWDAIWADGDFFKSGLNTQGIYVSPDKDLVIAYFSLEPTQQIQKYLRPLVNSGIFNN